MNQLMKSIHGFKVYEIIGRCEDGTLLFELKGGTGPMDQVQDLNEAEMYLNTSIKWDGCSDWNFKPDECDKHFCGFNDADTLGQLMKRMYEIARDVIEPQGLQLEKFSREMLNMEGLPPHVKILHCIEAGSRAWGMASSDSDYDIRFIYHYPWDEYLSLQKQPDSMDYYTDADHDFCGWDIYKALHLLRASNVSLLEHLRSPITYQAVPGFCGGAVGYCPGVLVAEAPRPPTTLG